MLAVSDYFWSRLFDLAKSSTWNLLDIILLNIFLVMNSKKQVKSTNSNLAQISIFFKAGNLMIKGSVNNK